MNSYLGLPSPPVQRQSSTKWFLLGTLFIFFALAVLWSCGKGVYRDYRLTLAGNDLLHQQFNRGDYEEIYSEATDDFRGVGSRTDDIKFFQRIHDQLGDAGKMSIKGFHINATSRGTFVNEVFDTQFSLGTAQEVLIWRVDEGTVRLVTYHIASPNLH